MSVFLTIMAAVSIVLNIAGMVVLAFGNEDGWVLLATGIPMAWIQMGLRLVIMAI